MISRDFLRAPGKVEGLEFLDFQNSNFAEELTKLFDQYLSNGRIDQVCEEPMLDIISKYTGFKNIKVNWVEWQNYAVDTGYFSPKHILNISGIDEFYSHTETTLYRYFQKKKTNIFKAGVDYRTGKVTGAFCDIPVNLYMGYDAGAMLDSPVFKKFGVGLPEVLAAVVCHELGHIFGGCSMIFTAMYQNVLGMASLRAYQNTTTKEEKVIILKDVGKLLEINKQDSKEIENIAASNNDETMVLYYSKMLKVANQNRALSLGVPEMTSEVMADAYAMRMGFTKGILTAAASLTEFKLGQRVLLPTIWISMLLGVLFSQIAVASLPLFVVIWGGGTLLTLFGTYFGINYAGDYNSDPRRLDDLLRGAIQRIREDKQMSPKDKLELVGFLTKVIKQIEKTTPFYDNTVVERFVGYIFHGGDYKLMNIEHFTQQLANHEVNLLTSQLASIEV